MKWLYPVFLFLLGLTSCTPGPNTEDQLVIDRITWMNTLRASLDTTAWPGLADSAFHVPLLYFTDSASWVANPTGKFLQQQTAQLLWESPSLKVYKTSKRINDQPFLMVTGMDIADTASFVYLHPYIYGSSPEETRKTIPDVQSTEAWASMILHEYFHGFQFRHKPLVDYYATTILPIQADSLSKIYRKCDWFREQLDVENDLLLQALATENPDSLARAIQSFNVLRENRRTLYQKFYGLDIAPYEDYYEKIEGSARYLEAYLLHSYKNLPPFPELLRTDSTYKAHLDYLDFSLEQEPWLYLSSKTGNYVYATGFNQLRLLDKLGVAYKDSLFNKPQTSLGSLIATCLQPTL